VQSWSANPTKIIIPMLSSSNWTLFLICMHGETSKFKHSILTLVSPFFQLAIRDNNITPTMTFCEVMNPIEHVLLHPICVLSHLMCACKHCNIKLTLYCWTHWSCWWIYHFKKKTDLTRFFIIKPRHLGRLIKADLSGKNAQWEPSVVTWGKTPAVVTWSGRLKIPFLMIKLSAWTN